MAYKILRQLSPATATTQDYTSSGFGTPTAAIIYATQASADNTATDHLNLSFGVYDGTTQWMCGINSEHGVPNSDTHRISSAVNCLELCTPGTGTPIVAATASFITDGVRLSFSTATNQVLVTVILFSDVGTVVAGTTALSTQNTAVNVSTLGFNPKPLIACSIGANTATVEGTFALFSLGMFDGTTQKCFGWSIADAAAAADPGANLFSNRIAAQRNAWNADAANIAGGFSLTARDADSDGDIVFWLAMECPNNDVWVGGFTNPTTLDATWDASNGSFQPDFALDVYTTCGAEDTHEFDADAGVFAIGVATEALTGEMCISLSDEDGSTVMDTQSFVDGDTMCRVRADAGGLLLSAGFDSFQATGRRLTVAGTPAAAWRHFGLQMSSASVSYSLSVDAGVVDVVGQAANLLVARTISANAGIVSIAGQDASLLVGRVLAADAGIIDVTGQAAGLFAARLLSAEAGVVIISGQDVGLSAGKVFAVDAGVVNISGQDVSLLAARLLSADAGVVVVSGQDVGLFSGFSLAVDAGLVDISGQDVGLTVARRLSADAGLIVISGQDVGLIVEFEMMPEFEAAINRRHAEDVFREPEWVYTYPTVMAAPEIAPLLPDLVVDTEDCFLRRPEMEDACLRRSDEDELALRRAPECPDQFACPVSGCV